MKIAKSKILSMISQHLRRVKLNNITLDVVPGEIDKRNGCWYVLVRPSAPPPSMFQFYEALADVETELSEQNHIHVWLVPTVPA